VLRERAKVRVEAYKKAKYSTILPAIPSYDWDKLREVGIIGKKIVIPKELMLFLSEENQIEETEVTVGKVISENFYPSKVIKRFCTMTEEEENAELDEEYEMIMNVDKAEYNELDTERADKSLDDEEDPEEPRRESPPEPEWKTKPLPKLDWAQEKSDDEKKKQVEKEDLARMDPTMRNPSPPQRRRVEVRPRRNPLGRGVGVRRQPTAKYQRRATTKRSSRWRRCWRSKRTKSIAK